MISSHGSSQFGFCVTSIKGEEFQFCGGGEREREKKGYQGIKSMKMTIIQNLTFLCTGGNKWQDNLI